MGGRGPRESGAVTQHLAEGWRKTTPLNVDDEDSISNLDMGIVQEQTRKMRLIFHRDLNIRGNEFYVKTSETVRTQAPYRISRR